MQKQLKVSINGRVYAIATDEHEQDIYEAARLIDSLMLNKGDKPLPKGDDRMALIVALQIATDLTKTRKLLETSEQRLKHLVALMDKESL